MITLERVGLLTGTALPDLCASLSQMKQHPSLLAGEHTTCLPPMPSFLSCVSPSGTSAQR